MNGLRMRVAHGCTRDTNEHYALAESGTNVCLCGLCEGRLLYTAGPLAVDSSRAFPHPAHHEAAFGDLHVAGEHCCYQVLGQARRGPHLACELVTQRHALTR